MKRLAICILALLLLFSAGIAHAAYTVQVGLYENPPLIFTENDRPAGLFVDLLEYVAREEGWQLEYRTGTWPQNFERLQNGSIDLLPCVAYTPERARRFDFTEETIFSNWGQVYVGFDRDIPSLPDLAGQRVAVLRDDVFFDEKGGLRELSRQMSLAIDFVVCETMTEVLEAVDSGRAEAGLVNRMFGLLNEHEYRIQRAPIYINPIEIRYALPQTRKLAVQKTLDYHLGRLKETPGSFYYRAMERWLDHAPPTVLPNWWLPAVGSAGAGFILLTVLIAVTRGQVRSRTREIARKNAELKKEIAGRARIEAELVNSRDNYLNIFDAFPAMVRSVPGDGGGVYFNRPWLDFTGGQADDQQGGGWQRAIHPGDRDEFVAVYTRCLQERRAYELEYRLRRSDGEYRWVKEIGRPQVDRGGGFEGFLGICTDITERRETMEQLNKLSRAVEHSPSPVVITDTEGKIEYVNPKFTTLTGYSMEEVLGRNPNVLKSGHTSEEEYASLWGRITGGEVWQGEFYNKKKDGGHYWETASISPIKNSDGVITHFVAVKEDITERKLAEEEQVRAREAAEEASRAKSQFLANMSHEIRTPMNGVLGMLDLALDEELSGEVHENLRIARTSGESLLHIINDILDFSKIEAGKLEFATACFDLPELMAETAESFRFACREKGLQLVHGCASDIPRHVVGDPQRLRQVLVNLLGNAVKFTERGRVEVAARVAESGQGTAIRFEVCDTGPGIPEEGRDRLFQSFSQLDGSSTRQYGGTGLGLAISREIVRCMGGEIDFESRSGEGSVFRFDISFPAAREEDVGEPDMTGRNGEHKLAGSPKPPSPRVLLVEDNPVNAMVARRLLEKKGWQVSDAGDGRQAVEVWARESFDLILMDIQMPVMDGFEATEEIRRRENPDARTPIVAITAHAMTGDRERCLKGGMDNYIAKPIMPDVFFSVCEEALGRSTAAARSLRTGMER